MTYESGNCALSVEQKQWAYEKWCEGYTQNQIADALFVDPKTIRRAISGRPRIRPVLQYEAKKTAEKRALLNSKRKL